VSAVASDKLCRQFDDVQIERWMKKIMTFTIFSFLKERTT
jgi:hypothetical protein